MQHLQGVAIVLQKSCGIKLFKTLLFTFTEFSHVKMIIPYGTLKLWSLHYFVAKILYINSEMLWLPDAIEICILLFKSADT